MKVSRFEAASIKRTAKTVAVYDMQVDRINRKVAANDDKVRALREKIRSYQDKCTELTVEAGNLRAECEVIMNRIEAYTKPLEASYGRPFKELVNEVTGATESAVEEEIEEPVEVEADESAATQDSDEMYRADEWPFGVAFNRTEDID